MNRWNSYLENTLIYDPNRCVNCGRCIEVCPHRVFISGSGSVVLDKKEACMECGACERNCPVSAIQVDSGVGCAYAMIRGALTGKEECGCGDGGSSGCCT